MLDSNLLIIARKHEKFLMRLESGEIERGLNFAKQALELRVDDKSTMIFIAQVLSAFKAFLFETDIMPDLREIKRIHVEREKKINDRP